MKLNMKKTLILFSLVPLTVGIIAFSILAGEMLTNSVETNIKEELLLASTSLKEYYEYDLIHGIDLVDGFCEYDTEYIDRMSQTGIDFTLFNKDTRFMTTIVGNDGKRIEGTKASEIVWATVSSGKDYYSDDVVINGIDYYVYYLPMGDNGNVVGMAFSGKPCTDVKAAEKKLYAIITIGAITMELLFLLIAWLVSKKISAPIQEVSENISQLSNGTTNINVTAISHIQETLSLINSAKRLSGVLSDSISSIQKTTDALKNSVESTSDIARETSAGTLQISDAMNNLSRTTETMAESVQEVNTSIIEMGNMIDGIVENAQNLRESSDKMANAENKAKISIEQMGISSESSANAVEAIVEKIHSTNDSIKKINEMVELITGIAEQTNLLSLNASIEAARAGEAGRGFGVVATEIKSLAEQSGESAEKILAVANEISKQSEECVDESQKVRELINKEQDLLVNTKECFDALKSEIEISVEEIKSVSDAASKLNISKTSITESVSDLSAISEETAATNEEVSENVINIAENVKKVSEDSDNMNLLSGELKEAVSYFS